MLSLNHLLRPYSLLTPSSHSFHNSRLPIVCFTPPLMPLQSTCLDESKKISWLFQNDISHKAVDNLKLALAIKTIDELNPYNLQYIDLFVKAHKIAHIYMRNISTKNYEERENYLQIAGLWECLSTRLNKVKVLYDFNENGLSLQKGNLEKTEVEDIIEILRLSLDIVQQNKDYSNIEYFSNLIAFCKNKGLILCK